MFQTLEGHLRSILGTLTVEEVNSDRQSFAQKLTSEAATDLEKMGLGVDVLTIQEISDEEEYLNALGKRRTAEVKRDATIGEAEAHRDAKIKSSQALQEGEQAKFKADAEIAQALARLHDPSGAVSSRNRDAEGARRSRRVRSRRPPRGRRWSPRRSKSSVPARRS